jgi:hypothetical protein
MRRMVAASGVSTLSLIGFSSLTMRFFVRSPRWVRLRVEPVFLSPR